MKAIKEQYLLDRKGQLLQINIKETEDSAKSFTVTLCWALKYILGGYVPSESMTLTLNDIRILNKILDTLEEHQDKIDETINFEDEHFEILMNVTEHILPLIMLNPILMNGPKIIDILNESEVVSS